MKRFLLVLALAVPFGVNAMATSETFDIGDEVVVALKEGDTEQTGGRAFHVLKASAAGEETVTLIFDGTADEKEVMELLLVQLFMMRLCLESMNLQLF